MNLGEKFLIVPGNFFQFFCRRKERFAHNLIITLFLRVKWSPSGQLLAIGSYDQKVKLKKTIFKTLIKKMKYLKKIKRFVC